MRKISGIRCLSISSSRKLIELGVGAGDRPLRPVVLLGRGEVGAEEEDLQLAVAVERRRRTGPAGRGSRPACPSPWRPRRGRRRMRERRPASSSSPTPRALEKSTSPRASSTRRRWSSPSRLLRVTFSVASTVRSATSLRICSSERRVSASMSRFAASTSSSRFSLPATVASASAVSADFAGAGHDVVGLLPRLGEPAAVLGQQLVGFAALPLGRVDRLGDRLRPPIQGLLDFREGDLAEDPHREQEEDQGPDHQAEARRDEEAATAFLRCDAGPRLCSRAAPCA